MPYLKLQTNIEIDVATQKSLLKQLSSTVAELLGKSEKYVMVAVEAATPMLFGGDDSPCAYLELKSLGLPEDQTTRFSESLCGTIGEMLNLPTSRIYIEFASPPRHLWGWDNRTFG